MRTTISVSLDPQTVTKTRQLARKRGFSSTSDYVRFLLSSDDSELISEEEILYRSKQADILHKAGKLVKEKSMADLLK